VISSDGKHAKNVKARKNKSHGHGSDNADIGDSIFRKYHFEVAKVGLAYSYHQYCSILRPG
jgi:hypothetical protein